jgi:TPR repeat protein
MKLIFPCILAAVFMALPCVASADPLQDGQAAYQRHDYATALRVWRGLAEQGSAPAEFSLGLMYSRGSGVPQDYAEAIKLYLEAANQGNGAAQLKLGTIFARGRMAPQDNTCALMWYNLAAARGVEYASGRRDALERAIPRYQVAQAQSLSQDWKEIQPGSQAAAPRDKACPRATPSRSGFVVLD